MKTAGLVWPTIAAIVGLSVLVSLGNWQWRRKIWKDGLISQITLRTTEPHVVLQPEYLRAPSENEYMRVAATGTFDHGLERHVYAGADDGTAGWHIFAPLVLEGGSRQVVWINRGFVPDALKSAAARPGSQPSGTVTVRGLLRAPPVTSWFTPANDPVGNIWYWPAISEMQRATIPAVEVPDGIGYVDAEPTVGGEPGGKRNLPRPGTTNLKLSNKHFGYALTWWGLAAALAGVYLMFAIQRLSVRRGSAG